MRRGIVDWFFVSLPFMRRERRERCLEIPNNPKREASLIGARGNVLSEWEKM